MANFDTDDELIVQTEKYLLGNILSDSTGQKMLTAVQYISPSDFTDENNSIVYSALVEINQSGKIPDISLLQNKLADNKQLDKVGGLAFVRDLVDHVVMTPIEPLISTIKDRALLNRFVSKLKELYDKATEEKVENVSEFIGKAETEINEIAKQRSIKEALRLNEISPSLVIDWVEQTKDARAKGIRANGIIGLETGYEELDSVTKGWQKSHMIIIGARPSVGKTAFALQLLYNVAKRNIPVIFFSLEMDAKKIEERLLAMATGLSSYDMHTMMYEPSSTAEKLIIQTKGDLELAAKVKRLQAGLKELSKMPFYIDDNPGTTMLDISAKCRKLINGQNIKAGLIAIDYLGLIQSNRKTDNRQNEVADISRQIKQLARDLRLPIIVLSQLSREVTKRGVKDHTPQLSDLRDSGALEQDADLVFFLDRDDYYKKNNSDLIDSEEDNKTKKDDGFSDVKLILSKNRDGVLKTLKFTFDKPHCRFTSINTDIDSNYEI